MRFLPEVSGEAKWYLHPVMNKKVLVRALKSGPFGVLLYVEKCRLAAAEVSLAPQARVLSSAPLWAISGSPGALPPICRPASLPLSTASSRMRGR